MCDTWPSCVSTLQVSSEPGMRYNIPLINALVLYVGTQAITYINTKGLTPSMSTIAHSSHMDIFQNLAVDLDTEGVCRASGQSLGFIYYFIVKRIDLYSTGVCIIIIITCSLQSVGFMSRLLDWCTSRVLCVCRVCGVYVRACVHSCVC